MGRNRISVQKRPHRGLSSACKVALSVLQLIPKHCGYFAPADLPKQWISKPHCKTEMKPFLNYRPSHLSCVWLLLNEFLSARADQRYRRMNSTSPFGLSRAVVSSNVSPSKASSLLTRTVAHWAF